MPRPEAIEQFRRVLTSLTASSTGVAAPDRQPEAEPGIPAGEQPEEPVETLEDASRAPGQSEVDDLPPDLGELLGDLGAETETAEEPSLDLGGLLGEEAQKPPADFGEEAPEAPAPQAPIPAATGPEEPGETEAGAAEAEPSEPLEPQGPSAEEALLSAFAGEPSEELSEELPSLGADLDQLTVVPEGEEPAAGTEPAAAEQAEQPLPGPEAFMLPDEFESAAMPAGETAPTRSPQEAEGTVPEETGAPGLEAPAAPRAIEGFELGDLGDLTLGEIPGTAEAEAEPLAAPPRIERGPQAAPSRAGAPAGIEEETAELPDIGGLDELTLPGGPEQAPEEQAPVERPGRLRRPPAGRARPPGRAPAERGRPPGRAPAAEAEAAAADQAAREVLAGEGGEISLTDEQFDRLRRTLATLPRNLKIIVQDLIAEGQGSPEDIRRLIGLLVEGAAPQAVATLAGRITGRRIRLPAAFEKRTGLAFEEARRGFAFAFRQNILPLAGLFALAAIGAALVGFLGYQFVYQPIQANTTYRRGYEQIRAERYPLANQRFDAAARVWPMRGWYYRYAEAFTGKRQYDLAAQKYQALLDRWPGERRAVLEWSKMESALRARYEEANRILQQRLLNAHPWDYQGLLAAGDNYLEWAAEQPAHYEDARLSWAKLMQRYGQPDAVLFRMLRYFVRTDNLAEADRLRALFLGRRPLRLDATGAESFAELGGFLVTKRQFDWAREVLSASAKADPLLPDPHYQLARFYRAMQQPAQELASLDAAIALIDAQARLPQPMSLRQVLMQVDTRTRYGEVLFDQGRPVEAEQALTVATQTVTRYERSGVLVPGYRAPGGALGRPFARLADVHYFVSGDLAKARTGYREAIARGYGGPEIDYRLGYIAYAGQDWSTAQGLFLQAEDGLATAQFAPPDERGVSALQPAQVPTSLLFALGNAFYERGDWSAAEGTWRRLLEILTTRRQAIRNFQPLDRTEHRALLEGLVKTKTNLGVAMERLAERSGNRELESQALVLLAEAAEGADALGRDPQTMAPGEAISLASLDMRGILYPLAGFRLQIFRAIPKDMLATSF